MLLITLGIKSSLSMMDQHRVYVDGKASSQINSTVRNVDNTDSPPLWMNKT